MSDEFASSSDRTDEKAKSPHSGLPYYVPASQSSMRDKLPRINVPPSFFSAMNAIVAKGVIPEFRDAHSIIRYCISVGLHSLNEDLNNPDFTGFYNHWSTLAKLDLLGNRVEAFRALSNKVEEISRDHDTSPDIVEGIKEELTVSIEHEKDPYYRRELEQMLARLR